MQCEVESGLCDSVIYMTSVARKNVLLKKWMEKLESRGHISFKMLDLEALLLQLYQYRNKTYTFTQPSHQV